MPARRRAGAVLVYVAVVIWVQNLALPTRGDGGTTGTWPNMTYGEISNSFWLASGPRLPSTDFVKAVQEASLPVRDARGHERRVVVMSISSEFTFSGEGLWELFLTNLRNITFALPNGTMDHLARHLVATVMTLPGATADNCNRISNPFGAKCVTIDCPIFTPDNYGYKTPPFYGLSFAKVVTILDALTVNVDVFFLDCDQFFFQNPLPYMLARDIDILVSGDCQRRPDSEPADRFPKIGSNIGVLYMRPTPMVVRAVSNWLAHLVWRARADAPVLDQSTFTGAMEWASMEMGSQVLSVAMLRGDLFPHWCMGPCGCNVEGVDMWERGKTAGRRDDNTCEPNIVRMWYNYHVPCNGDMNTKARTLLELLAMYDKLVGPVNSLSEPLDVL